MSALGPETDLSGLAFILGVSLEASGHSKHLRPGDEIDLQELADAYQISVAQVRQELAGLGYVVTEKGGVFTFNPNQDPLLLFRKPGTYEPPHGVGPEAVPVDRHDPGDYGLDDSGPRWR